MSSDACKISKSIQKKIKFKHAKNIYTGGCQPKISVLLHGMVQTLNEISDIQIPTMLLPDDFKSYVKMSVNFRNVVRPGFPSTYKLKLYLPLVFKSLRSKFNVSEQQFYDCFLSEPKQSQHSTNFYKSSDRIFNLRFLENDDVSAFIAMIERYYNHIVMNNNNTFLPMYVGLCRILVDGKYIYVIIMKNSLYFPNTETISRQFFSFSNKEAEKEGICADVTNMNFSTDDETLKTINQRLSKDLEFLGNNSINKLTIKTKICKIISIKRNYDLNSTEENISCSSGSSITNEPSQQYITSSLESSEKLILSIDDFSLNINTVKRSSSKMHNSTKDSIEDNPKSTRSSINREKCIALYLKRTFATSSPT